MLEIEEKIKKLIKSSSSFGKVGLLIVEKDSVIEAVQEKTIKVLSDLGYEQTADYVELLTALNAKKDKVVYIEKADKLDGSVLEIIAEFEAGIVSLADRKNNSGLITAKWNPIKTSLIILISRRQVENSYKRLFEYSNIIQSL